MSKYIITTHGDRKVIKFTKSQRRTGSKWKTNILAATIAVVITIPVAQAGIMMFSDGSKTSFAYSGQMTKKQQNRKPLETVLQTEKRIVQVIGAAHFQSRHLYLSDMELARLTAIVKRLPVNAKITVVGHSDAPGSRDVNYTFALQRAQIVGDYIRSIGGNVVDIISKGEDNLFVDTQRSTWLNRRIDLIVKYDIKDEHTGQIRVRPDGKPYWWQKN